MTLPGPADWPVEDPISYPAHDLLRERARTSPDATFLVDADSGQQWSYAAFDARVESWRARLPSEIDGVGDRVGLLLDAGVAFPTLYFAIVRAGGTLVPLNTRLDAETLATQVRRADVDALVYDPDIVDDVAGIASGDVGVHSVAEFPPSNPESAPPPASPVPDVVQASPDTERLVVFTSGTTGQPKGVRLTMGNLVSSAAASAERLGVAPDDRWLVCLPMYHVGGLAPVVRSALYGTTAVLQSGFDPSTTATVLSERRITGVSLVPTMLTRLLDDGWSPPDHLRFVLLGGAPASVELVDRCEERGVPVCPTYGTTETASQVATALPAVAFEHRGTVGRPLAGTSVAVVDESGATRDAGDVGEIVVDGPTVTPGYLDPDQTADAFGPDGFETGDLGYRDEAGRLWVVGRVDDRIVTGGENVRPDRVAAAVREHRSVDGVVVVGVDDPEWGERVCALVATADDATLTEDTLLDHCRDRLADYEIPKQVVVESSLPRTASGTVDRERAREFFVE